MLNTKIVRQFYAGNWYESRVPTALTFRHLPISNEEDLLDQLAKDVAFTTKQRIVVLGGHFPLFYNEQAAYAAMNAWGAFSDYSFDLACKVARMVKGTRKEAKLLVLADDINFEDFRENRAFPNHNKARKRNAFYKSTSGEDGKLPASFAQVASQYGLTNNDFLRQNQEKSGRESSLVFSEKSLRANRSPSFNECAKAYRGLISSPAFRPDVDYLVAFIRDRCTGNICERVLNQESELFFEASHISMQTDSTLLDLTDKAGIWDAGVKYRKDSVCD